MWKRDAFSRPSISFKPPGVDASECAASQEDLRFGGAGRGMAYVSMGLQDQGEGTDRGTFLRYA